MKDKKENKKKTEVELNDQTCYCLWKEKKEKKRKTRATSTKIAANNNWTSSDMNMQIHKNIN